MIKKGAIQAVRMAHDSHVVLSPLKKGQHVYYLTVAIKLWRINKLTKGRNLMTTTIVSFCSDLSAYDDECQRLNIDVITLKQPPKPYGNVEFSYIGVLKNVKVVGKKIL